jgi:3-oxoadipate enol-lactonase
VSRRSTPRRVHLGDHETVVVDSGGSGVPLVLIHGVSFDWRMWTLVVERLPDSIRTVAYDLRGHGAAKAAPGRPTPPVLAADLAALFDVLEIEGARIAGLSYGGTVAQEFALAYPHRTVGLALVSTRASPFPPFAAGADAAERDGIKTQVEGALERWFGAEVVAEGGWPVEYARTCLRTIPLTTWTVALRAIAAFDVLDRLPEISVPTRVVAAELDTVGRPEHMQEIATRIPGARFHVLEGAHHLLCFLRPEELAGLLAT